ncbi:hypothetical protein HK100_000399 [Physocladia obscura]|uniref:Pyrroline-5-carboxylate reductase n=1 Tax=Physocladia obscura TaxID=109957 RepID=A0AAD5SZY0_9FUNG|nr:hypothetical protein HK100_000399 [Physocladia obscura]
MAKAMIAGLLAAGHPAGNITVTEPQETTLALLRTGFPGVRTSTDNAAAIFGSHVIVLATKPQVLKAVAEALVAPLKTESTNNPLILSIAAGIRVADLARWLDYKTIVRVMPNTPALVSEGASGLYASQSVSEKQKDLAFAVCASFSKLAYWLDKEQLLDVVTGTSGSGPAYFLYLCEAMVEAAVEQGMPREIARGLVAQTCLGVGKMTLSQLDTEFSVLRRNVTSPKGTTEAGIKVFDDNNVKQHMKDCVVAATKRADELGDILGSQVKFF